MSFNPMYRTLAEWSWILGQVTCLFLLVYLASPFFR